MIAEGITGYHIKTILLYNEVFLTPGADGVGKSVFKMCTKICLSKRMSLHLFILQVCCLLVTQSVLGYLSMVKSGHKTTSKAYFMFMARGFYRLSWSKSDRGFKMKVCSSKFIQTLMIHSGWKYQKEGYLKWLIPTLHNNEPRRGGLSPTVFILVILTTPS